MAVPIELTTTMVTRSHSSHRATPASQIQLRTERSQTVGLPAFAILTRSPPGRSYWSQTQRSACRWSIERRRTHHHDTAAMTPNTTRITVTVATVSSAAEGYELG